MKIILLIFSIVLIACSAPSGSKKSSPALPDHNDQILPQTGAYVADPALHLAFAFEKLSASCFAAKGTFDVLSRNCLCPNGSSGEPASFQAIYRVDIVDGLKKRVFDHHECKALHKFVPVSKTESTFEALLKSSPEAFIRDLTSPRNGGNGRTLEFKVSSGLDSKKLTDLAQFLDSKPLFINIPNGNQKRESFKVSLFDQSDFIGYTKRMGAYDFEDTASIERGGNEVFAWNNDDLMQLDGLKENVSDGVELKTSDPLIRDLLSGLEIYRQHVRGSDQVEIHEDLRIIDEGCHILCDYYAAFIFNDRTFWLEKNYARGQAFRQAIYMVRPDGTLDAMAILFGSLKPSVVITEKAILDSQGGLTVTNDAFTSALQPLYSKNSDVIHASEEFYKKFESLAKVDVAETRNVVISLDGTTRLEEDWEKDFWLRGPYASNSPRDGGSLMGWTKPQDSMKNLLEFFFGVFDPNWNTDGKHTREVLHDLMKDFKKGEAYAISTDFGLLVEGNRFDELVRLSGSRVLSMSGIYYIDEGECNRVFASVKSDVLWVLGAGNEGRENPKFRCPQRLQRPDTKLVVAAGANGRLADFAEFGKGYADIAADSTSYLGTRGSSFAAPKVSNVAIKIIDRFGVQISNSEVRLAILIGAKVDINNRIEVRSGGYLDQEGAMKVAKAILALSAGMRKSLVDKTLDRSVVIQALLFASGVMDQKSAQLQARYLLDAGI